MRKNTSDKAIDIQKQNSEPPIKKPCFICGRPAPTTFDADFVFNEWSSANQIICDGRSRFDEIRSRLAWSALDESDTGAHPDCALTWAVSECGFSERYPNCLIANG